jgi:replicative DNA helicase
MLIDHTAILETAGHVDTTDFYSPAHQHIHDAIRALDNTAQPVDINTVGNQLGPTLLAQVGGTKALTQLHFDTPNTRNARGYADIIRKLAELRHLAHIGREITQAALAGGDPDEIIDQAQQLVYQTADTHNTRRAVTASAMLTGYQDNLDDRATNGRTVGVPTGLVDLDNKILGLRGGQLIVIAARPGMGKSLLGAQIAAHAAETGHPALFVSVEMSVEEIADRLVAADSQVDLTNIRSGHLKGNDWARISTAVTRISNFDLHVLDAAGTNLNGIRTEIRRLSTRAPVGLVVVDYLQLLQGERRENRQVEVADLSAGLKRIAREYSLPVLALAQLNRGLEYRSDKRPGLADLRESGAIENDADLVIGIYRDDYYNENSPDKGTAELIILKQRNGPLGTVHVNWIPSYGRFVSAARQVA